MSEQTDCAQRQRKPPQLENKGSLITYKDDGQDVCMGALWYAEGRRRTVRRDSSHDSFLSWERNRGFCLPCWSLGAFISKKPLRRVSLRQGLAGGG
jgi:hypothetical protein